MRILGICHDVWICSAAVIEDGRVVSAVAEERLDRRKLSRVFPSMAVARTVEEAGLSLRNIDEIAVAWNPSIEMQTTPSGYLSARRWRTEHLFQVPARIMQQAGAAPSDMLTIDSAFEDAPPITYVNHYDTHIGASYCRSCSSCSPTTGRAENVTDGRSRSPRRRTCRRRSHGCRTRRSAVRPRINTSSGSKDAGLTSHPDPDVGVARDARAPLYPRSFNGP